MSALLPLSVQKLRLEKDMFHALPEHLLPIAQRYTHVYKIIVTPVKNPQYKGVVRVTITAPANFRTGNIILENAGRVPATPPPEGQDDLRSIVHYVMGSGSIRYRGVLMSNQNVFVETTVTL